MRIVMMGTPEFAVPTLEALIESSHEVVGVFTQPDRPSGRGRKLTAPPVKGVAEAHGIPVFQPERIRKTGVETLRELKPDLCVTAAFGQILSQEILDIPPIGNINVHASLLPRHRGAAPIAYAILQGDKEAGVTTMKMDAGIDTGDILLQAATPIGESETCGELTARLSHLGAGLLMETLKQLEEGSLQSQKQNEALMTYDPMLRKEMGELDFSMEAARIRGVINGLNPWPCATALFGEEKLKLLRAAVSDGNGKPGEILTASPEEGLRIACGKGAVRILELRAPGGKRMRAEDYLRGHHMDTGRIVGGESI